MPPVVAKHLGLTEVERQKFEHDDLAWPCLVVLPMGFSWSVYLAQRCGEEQLSHVESLSREHLMADHGGSVVLSNYCQQRHYLYVDNIGVIGLDHGHATSSLHEACN